MRKIITLIAIILLFVGCEKQPIAPLEDFKISSIEETEEYLLQSKSVIDFERRLQSLQINGERLKKGDIDWLVRQVQSTKRIYMSSLKGAIKKIKKEV